MRKMSNNTNNDRRNDSSSQSWLYAGAAAVGIGLAAYFMSGKSKKEEVPQNAAPASVSRSSSPTRRSPASTSLSRPSPSYNEPAQRSSNDDTVSSYLTNMVSRLLVDNSNTANPKAQVQCDFAPAPVITNLNSLLSDIYARYIKLQESELHYMVFDTIFQDLHKKMKEVDAYYSKYSSTVQFAGSHYDNLRITKLDEFDMDIVISLPINFKVDPFNPERSDVILEAKAPGFVQLKMGEQFQRLHMRDRDEWLNNRAAYEWMDSCNYLQRDKFIEWFDSVVTRALNLYEVNSDSRPVAYVRGVPYIIGRSKSGPAITLLIRNAIRNFKLDVDLVPALKFPESRWPISKAYRSIPAECRKDYWTVVPKPNKDSLILQDQKRSWRIALHIQERVLLYKTNHLRTAIKLIKKLRDAQNMNKIASYYIKTLFFWEVVEINDISYWNNNPATIFKRMVGKFHQALVIGNIPYFWNHRNNLIGSISRDTLDQYARKLVPLMSILEDPSKYKLVAKFLLTREQFDVYNAKFLLI